MWDRNKLDKTVEDLIIKVESLELRLVAVEDALLNISGFQKQTADGSQQGRIKYEQPKVELAVKEGA